MKELILQILKIFAGKAANKIENGAAATNNEALANAAGEAVKSIAGGAAKAAIGGATSVAAGSALASSLLPIIAGVIGLSLLTVGGIALKNHITKDVTIDKTANVVEKIRTISEFTSACYYEEAVLKNDKVEAGKQNKLMQIANIDSTMLAPRQFFLFIFMVLLSVFNCSYAHA